MINVLYILAGLWAAWLLFDGLLTGEIWVKGGSKDRFTRTLDMHSFAHKVGRGDSPTTYWVNAFLYLAFIIIPLWALLAN